ncbi:MAG: single-stranded DNA-binding protein [Candidatus Brocadiaceae bacterium]|nr:single-stranded DNA-binding protein [Candidatus Brocadiaceae bacterium]
MFDDLRQVTITGGLTQDPEMKQTNSGTSVLKLNVGCNQSRKGQSGDYEQINHYFEVSVWSKYAEMMQSKLSKGMKVMITGDLEFQSWEQDGQKRSKILINAKQVKPLSKNESNGGQSNNYGSNQKPAQSSQNFENDIPF